MRLKWFKNLPPVIQLLILSGVIFALLLLYLPLAKYIRPAIASLLFSPLKFCKDLSINARQLLSFEDLAEENKRLKKELAQNTLKRLPNPCTSQLTSYYIQLQAG